MCGFVQVACQGFLVREACVDILLDGAVFLLSPFEELGCFSGCLMSSSGIQKLFCGIYLTFKCSFDEFVGEKVFSPSYSSAILAPPVFLYFFSLIPEEGSLISPCYSLELCIQKGIFFLFSFAFCFSFFSQLFVRPPQTTILSFCIFFPLGMVLITTFYNV